MPSVQYKNTNYPTPFQVVQATAPFAGVDGLLGQLTAQVKKNGGTSQPAKGQLIAQGDGFYALMGHQDDRDQLGTLIVGAEPPDPSLICLWREYEVVNYDPYASPTQEESDLADIKTLLQRIATALRA